MTSQFPHINLPRVLNARPKKAKPRKIPRPPRTEDNLNTNRQLHAGKLLSSLQQVTRTDNQTLDDLSFVNDYVSLFLEIDTSMLKVENLRAFGIELVSELDDGLIIGCSSDTSLSTLQKKIEKFLSGAQHNVAGLYSIESGFQGKPEHILSPDLYEKWPTIKDEESFLVDIGVSCVGTFQWPSRPEQPNDENDPEYIKAMQKWEKQRQKALQQWDDLQLERSNQLHSFLKAYGSVPDDEYYELVDAFSSRLSDSFTCRTLISGKCLRDLVRNFPFVFDVSSRV